MFLISSCDTQIQPEQTVCNKPYILVGNDCCLDKDGNSICDKDEQKEDYTQNIGGSPVSADQGSKESPVFRTSIKSDDQISHAKSRQDYLEEVREWVSGTPIEGIEEIYKRDAVKTIDLNREMSLFPDQRLTSITSQPRPIESQKGEESEIHDFHISIGTISLTIEEPEKEIQSHKPLQIRKERNSMQESNSSRLSRHYIRIR